jgi:MinD-like ATPase involved in chromosome partitioning or flagellar assembly
MKPNITFDSSLSAAVQTVRELFPEAEPESFRFIRDITGQIHVLVPDDVPQDRLDKLSDALDAKLQHYSPGKGSVALRPQEALGGQALYSEPYLVDWVEQFPAYLIERRAMGQDWVVLPGNHAQHPPRFVFYSLKGGVGRSTALLLWGRHLAHQNKTVLLVDLDLEAPGLGAQLLPAEQRPEYGVADWLVEDLAGGRTEEMIAEMAAQSPVSKEPGLIVVPALGGISKKHLNNVIAKLARAHLEGEEGPPEAAGFAGRLNRMFHCLEQRISPDVVLIDSRAGLHETAAANLLHLDAEALLFAEDLPVTWQSYSYLFHHLAQLAQSASFQNKVPHWRERFKMVHARADGTAGSERRFVSNSFNLWIGSLYDEVLPEDIPAEAFSFDQNDSAAPHWPFTVLRSEMLECFNPLQDLSAVGEKAIESVFAGLFQGLAERLEAVRDER